MSDNSRSKAQIQADIAAARARLAANVEGLISEAHPKAVAKRRIDDIKTLASNEMNDAKAQVKDEYGWRYDRLAMIGFAVFGVVIAVNVVRHFTKKK